jgi:hypothetical protein
MYARKGFPNDSLGAVTSRRNVLRTVSIASVASAGMASTWTHPLPSLIEPLECQLTSLTRTKTGRAFSRDRYDSAEFAFAPIEAGFFARDIRTTLHQAGAVAKLALSAHLLDVGFSDEWNATNFRQDIAKALAYANATGLGHDCPGMTRLAVILSPYWKWGYPHLIGDPSIDDGGFEPERIRLLVRALLDRVADGTGHPRPQCIEHFQREARS